VPGAAGRRYGGLVRAVNRGPGLQRGCGLLAAIRGSNIVLQLNGVLAVGFGYSLGSIHLCSALDRLNGEAGNLSYTFYHR